MKTKNNTEGKDKIRMIAIMIVSLFVIATGTLFSLTSFMKGNIAGGVGGGFIAITILAFAIFVFRRGNRDIKKGFPLQDERSRSVLEKASSKAFYVSLYLLLAIGFLSEDIIHFRDVSQATSLAVGGMAILFAVFWAYYNRKEI
jgi:uncharacterized membrane protein